MKLERVPFQIGFATEVSAAAVSSGGNYEESTQILEMISFNVVDIGIDYGK